MANHTKAPDPMFITTPHRSSPVPATPGAIAEIIQDLPGSDDAFAVLGGSDKLRFIQTLWTPGGFVLEFQLGSVDRHYRSARRDLTVQEVTNAFQQYLTWSGNWRPHLEFQQVAVRRPTTSIAPRVTGWFRQLMDRIGD